MLPGLMSRGAEGGDRPRPPVEAPSSGANLDVTQIKALIQAREQARCAKDFVQADQIREQLRAVGIEVWDKEKTWKQPSTGLSGVILGYFGDRPPSDIEISALVIQREKARLKKDFITSDAIRDELKERGVLLFDKDLEWKTSDGRRGRIPTFDMIDKGLAKPGRAGSTGDLQAALLQLARNNPALAPQILSILPSLSPGDKTMTKRGGQVPAQPVTLSAEAKQAVRLAQQCAGRSPTDSEVKFLVQARENCRQAKDFGSSDAIRAEMKHIGIEVYDKEKVWKTGDGRTGSVPTWA